MQTSGEEDEDDAEIDEDVDIDELVDIEILEEFGDIEDEDEGEEETEEEAVERIKSELVEDYEDQVSSLENVQVYIMFSHCWAIPIDKHLQKNVFWCSQGV